jgi:hypothetical protein
MMRAGWWAVAALAALGGAAAQAAEIPGLIAYRNGAVLQAEGVRLCSVSVVMTNAPGDETLEFQLLASSERFGFKLTAARFDAAAGRLRPYRLDDADFSAPSFAFDRPFGKRTTVTGQVVGVLGETILARDYFEAFFRGRFVLQFRPAGSDAATRYLVGQPAGEAVRRSFTACVGRLQPE